MARRRTEGSGGGDRLPSAAWLLAQVGAHAAAKFAERLSGLGLSPPHAGILWALSTSGGLSQQALAEHLHVLPSRLVALVDELEERGLVERRDNPDDRRTYALHLTSPGRTMLEAIGRIARTHQESISEGLDAGEREQLAALLLRIADQQGLRRGVHPGFRSLGRGRGQRKERGR